MSASTAYALGVDKANVQLVFHVNLPFSLENLQQEAGRLVRVGGFGEHFIYYKHGDVAEMLKLLKGKST